MNATVRNKSAKPTAPERGSFLLDHDAECKVAVQAYMECLRNNQSVSHKCEELKKEYLSCRMSAGLMEKEDLRNLGMRDYADIKISKPNRDKEENGFIGGVAYAESLAAAKKNR